MGTSVWDLTGAGSSPNMAAALPSTFPFFLLLLLPILSEAVTGSCFVCSGDTSNSSRSSILCMGGEEEARKAACVALWNKGGGPKFFLRLVSTSTYFSSVWVSGTSSSLNLQCVAPNNYGCRVKASEAAGGKILWERSCCSEASCQEQGSAQSKIFVQSCTTDNCNFMDPSNGVLPHDTDEEVPEEEIALHEEPEKNDESDATSIFIFNSVLFVTFALRFV